MSKLELLFKGLIVLFLILIVIIIVYYIKADKNIDSNLIDSSNIYSKKEIDSLDFKEIENELKFYISELTNKSSNLRKFYANEVKYYNKENVNIDFIIKDKEKFFKKWDVIEFEISNIRINKINDSSYTCRYTKKFNSESTRDNSFYRGTVESLLEFSKEINKWKIIREDDEKIVITEKSQAFEEFLKDYISKVKKSKEYYLKFTDSPLITEVIDGKERQSADYWYSSVKQTVKSKYTITGTTVTFHEITYEHSEEGEDLAHEFIFRKDTLGKWKLFKIKWGGC